MNALVEARDVSCLLFAVSFDELSGKVDFLHMRVLLSKMNIHLADSRYEEELFQQHDPDHSGRLGFSEFRQVTQEGRLF